MTLGVMSVLPLGVARTVPQWTIHHHPRMLELMQRCIGARLVGRQGYWQQQPIGYHHQVMDMPKWDQSWNEIALI
jgi:hypothetical protein